MDKLSERKKQLMKKLIIMLYVIPVLLYGMMFFITRSTPDKWADAVFITAVSCGPLLPFIGMLLTIKEEYAKLKNVGVAEFIGGALLSGALLLMSFLGNLG